MSVESTGNLEFDHTSFLRGSSNQLFDGGFASSGNDLTGTVVIGR